MKPFNFGQCVLFVEGEYSDKSIMGPFVVTQVFALDEKMEEFKRDFKPENEWQHADPGSFIAWLHTEGYIEDMECAEHHIGSYGRLELDK